MDNNGSEPEFFIQTIKNDAPAKMTGEKFHHQIVRYGPVPGIAFCSVTYVPFVAEVEFEYVPGYDLVEFESFDEWLGKEVATEPHTIESMGLRIFSALLEVLGDIPLAVYISAKTTVHGPAETEVINSKWRSHE